MESALTFIHLTIRDPNKSPQPGASSFFLEVIFLPVGGHLPSAVPFKVDGRSEKTQLCIQGLTLMSSGALS